MCNVKNQTQIYKALCQRKKTGRGGGGIYGLGSIMIIFGFSHLGF